jgi:hypothetical protein
LVTRSRPVREAHKPKGGRKRTGEVGLCRPKWNPFEIFYNRVVAAPRGKSMLSPAPPPRAFAQGMAAAFMLLAGLALISGWMIAAWILDAFLVIAIAALLFGKFCLGAYVYHLLPGNISFANSTLPWAHPRT